jgi:hypothetical protein
MFIAQVSFSYFKPLITIIIYCRKMASVNHLIWFLSDSVSTMKYSVSKIELISSVTIENTKNTKMSENVDGITIVEVTNI